ncbi:hypothetical protein PFISCL1PPCAC_25132, partial [Pristionchus fissidentatus]
QENYVFMLNKHALEMTANWLCMTKDMGDVHDSSLFVTMDEESSTVLRQQWPRVKVLGLDVKPLQSAFNYGEGPYQLFYLLRSNLALAFLRNNASFWMTQQDTYWRSSLSSLNLSDYSEADIVFDRASSANVTFIAGGYYRARNTPGAILFFEELSKALSWWYTPDNAYMSSLCRRRQSTTSCGYLPFDSIPNWKWLYDHPAASWDELPPLLQFDGETQLGGKLETMRKLGFKFVSEPGSQQICRELQRSASMGQRTLEKKQFRMSLAHAQFCVYQAIVDALYSFPPTSALLDHVILPAAHFFMLTM